MLHLLLVFGTLLFAPTRGDSAAPDTVTAQHYRIYTADGTPASMDDVVEAMKDIDVLFIGETHNDPIVHYLQRTFMHKAYHLWHQEDGKPVALSMEMFARDSQYIVDEYLDDLISETQFLKSSQPWDNYDDDYRPLVEFAKEHKLDVVAANAPRRYTNRVTRLGRTSLLDLSETALSFLAPLPYGEASETYREQWDQAMVEAMEEMMAATAEADSTAAEDATDSTEEGMEQQMELPADHGKARTMEEHGELPADHGKAAGVEEHDDMATGTEHEEATKGHDEEAAEEEPQAMPPAGGGMHETATMLDAQSLWDATMAYSIAEYQTVNPGSLVIHIVGGFHVAWGTGIPEHLIKYRPSTRALIISVEPAEDINAFDAESHAKLGDFVILSDESLPRTFDAMN